jgi:hypothetical protein
LTVNIAARASGSLVSSTMKAIQRQNFSGSVPGFSTPKFSNSRRFVYLVAGRHGAASSLQGRQLRQSAFMLRNEGSTVLRFLPGGNVHGAAGLAAIGSLIDGVIDLGDTLIEVGNVALATSIFAASPASRSV